MPTYAELATEAVYRAEITPANMQANLIVPLREHYQMGPTLIGARGDNRHLRGRHRSRNWCLLSRFSTSRTYGTKDARDKRGDGDWLRAIDVGIRDRVLYDACRRLDAAVRAGRLPGVAEWFGTFDGKTVVGWFEGRPGSSDSSHLWHLHVGFWTEAANDEALMRLVYQVITGTEEDDMTPEQAAHLEALAWRTHSELQLSPTVLGGPTKGEKIPLVEAILDMRSRLTALESKPAVTVDAKAVAAELAKVLPKPLSRDETAQAAFEGAQQAERQ